MSLRRRGEKAPPGGGDGDDNLAYPEVGVQLASSAVPEGVAMQLPIQLRRDWIA